MDTPGRRLILDLLAKSVAKYSECDNDDFLKNRKVDESRASHPAEREISSCNQPVTVSSLQLGRLLTDVQTALDSARTCSVITSLPLTQLVDRDRFSGVLARMEENMTKIRDISSRGLVHWGGGGRVKWVCLGEDPGDIKDSSLKGTCPMCRVVMEMERLMEHAAFCEGYEVSEDELAKVPQPPSASYQEGSGIVDLKQNKEDQQHEESAKTERGLVKNKSAQKTRECHVELPYHKPEPRTLDEFLSRRKGTPSGLGCLRMTPAIITEGGKDDLIILKSEKSVKLSSGAQKLFSRFVSHVQASKEHQAGKKENLTANFYDYDVQEDKCKIAELKEKPREYFAGTAFLSSKANQKKKMLEDRKAARIKRYESARMNTEQGGGDDLCNEEELAVVVKGEDAEGEDEPDEIAIERWREHDDGHCVCYV